MTSYQRFLVTMGLSRTISEINDNFSQKSPIFLPRVLCAHANGVPLGIGYRRLGSKTTPCVIIMGPPTAEWQNVVTSGLIFIIFR